MTKNKVIVIRVSAEQEKILKEKMISSGLWKRSEYIRKKLFSEEQNGT